MDKDISLNVVIGEAECAQYSRLEITFDNITYITSADAPMPYNIAIPDCGTLSEITVQLVNAEGTVLGQESNSMQLGITIT